MNDPDYKTQDPSAHVDVDADVVCEQCGMVNEPGTLICRQCGNNLRDQRHMRLAMQEEEAPGPRPIRLLGGVLSVIGLLVIVWFAFNSDDIANQLVGVQADTQKLGAQFWTGGRASQFNTMADDLELLRENPPSGELITAAQNTPTPEGVYEGVYVLAYQDANVDTAMGFAKVTRDGEQLLFVALLNRGDQIRGTATIESDTRIVTTNAVADRRGLRSGGVGFAQPNAQGGYTIHGVGNQADEQFQILAFRLPD